MTQLNGSLEYFESQPTGPLQGPVEVPGSKSIMNRALIMAALASGESHLKRVLHSTDTKVLIDVLCQLGITINEIDEDILIQGQKGYLQPCDAELYIENAGTAARFLPPILSFGNGKYKITGNRRMQKRPINDLLQALQQMGCQINDRHNTGCLPLDISANVYPGGEISISGKTSSQYISALMIAAPYGKKELKIKIIGKTVSFPYIQMTANLMQQFGVKSYITANTITVPNQQVYQGITLNIEPDASSASYFFALAAVTQGKITVKGLTRKSLQGDIRFIDILEKMGCQVFENNNSLTLQGAELSAVEVDMNEISDTAPTLATTALFAKGKTIVKNVANMRVKECDRISAICQELRKINAEIEEFEDGFAIVGQKKYNGYSLSTYDDHRMAMAFSIIGTQVPGIKILDPACVNKTFPNYFRTLSRLIKEDSLTNNISEH